MATIKTILFLVLISLFVIFTLGCSTNNAARVYQTPRASFKNIGASPEIGIVNTADVGDSIYSEFDYNVFVDVVTKDELIAGRGLGSVNVPTNESLRGVTAPDQTTQFCSTRNLYRDPMTGPFDIVCLADFDADLRFEQFRVPSILFGKWKDIDAPVAYERVISDQHADDGKGYKYELVYQGLDDGDIKIAYREYVNNLARPAFTQIVEYELMAEETVIAFKGARISVEAASSNQITYVVQKGFNK